MSEHQPMLFDWITTLTADNKNVVDYRGWDFVLVNGIPVQAPLEIAWKKERPFLYLIRLVDHLTHTDPRITVFRGKVTIHGMESHAWDTFNPDIVIEKEG